ncbi:MAG: hypothetical protein IJV18_08825 [Acidaminococcaceae bacterium]|nr:hypothetical protein [Acidaminococcaceae bacterium]MBQ9256142.1 hypothetical protein [Acidaminococcaceae bacterium]MBR1661583.1 hypothetical protein [Acidaminococcaceae bacterium]
MDVQIKSMTRGQIKELRKAGLDPARSEKELSAADVTDTMEWIFDNVYPELAGDDSIPYDEVIRIGAETYAKSMGEKREIKN